MKKVENRTKRQVASKRPNKKEKLAIIDLAKAGKKPEEIKGAYAHVRESSVSALVAHHGPNGHRKVKRLKPQSISELRNNILADMESDLGRAVAESIRIVIERYRELLG